MELEKLKNKIVRVFTVHSGVYNGKLKEIIEDGLILYNFECNETSYINMKYIEAVIVKEEIK